jgi:hypothetical protein
MATLFDMQEVSCEMLADMIGELDATLAPLQKERDALAAQLKLAGAGRYTGTLWNATVVDSIVESVDWKAVAAKLNPSRQLVTAHTRQSPRTTLKITGVK